MAEATSIQAEDVIPVRSRISWSAIFAGAAVALAVYFLLGMFGTALGFSVSNRVTDRTLEWAAVVWAIVATLISLFVGGYIATQCAVGENKTEAVVHGVILWGVVFAALIWLVASGVTVGFNALVGATSVPGVRVPVNEDGLREAGMTEAQIQRYRDWQATSRQEWQAHSSQIAWWSFGGILLSMAAAIGGALAGSGPTLVLRRVLVPRMGARGATTATRVPVR